MRKEVSMSIEPIKLKTLTRFRCDTSTRAVEHEDLILQKGEPFYVTDFYIDGQPYNVLLVGNNTNKVDNFLSNKQFFVAGVGAGYILPPATTMQLGGIKINSDKGLCVGADGDTWVDVESFTGDNLKLQPTPGFPGHGKLYVDLAAYKGNVVIQGTLQADELLSTPAITGNVLKLRNSTGGSTPAPLGDTDVAGLEIQHINDDTVYFGIDKNVNLIFRNAINNYRVPIIPDSSLTSNVPLLGINSSGILQEAAINNITLKIRNNESSA